MQAAIVGSTVRIENFFDIGGAAVDPTTIVFKLKRPDDPVVITYTWPAGGGQIVRDAQGAFHVDFVPDVPQTWVYSWDASGTIEVTTMGTMEVLNADVSLLRVPAYLTSADLDNRIGAARVDMLFDDDGDSLRDAIPLNAIMVEAEDLAASWMLKGYPIESVVLLGKNDETFRGQVAWVAAELASERRQEFIAEDGKGRYWAQYTRAKEYFTAMSKAQLRSPAETVAGKNAGSGGSLSPTLQTNQPRFIFAPDRGSPTGHGGF
jgi:hypothetical protein